MAWVKWITEIRVVDRPFLGYWQARDYFRWERGLGEPVLVPLTEMEVKAQIAQPVNGTVVEAGRPVRIFGAAWSGSAPVEQVELTTDGQSWQPAALKETQSPYAWVLWEYSWTPAEPGTYTLLCRATDAAGNVQPESQQPDRESYLANWTVPVEVKVVPAGVSVDEYMI
jgi:hypothetical protein